MIGMSGDISVIKVKLFHLPAKYLDVYLGRKYTEEMKCRFGC